MDSLIRLSHRLLFQVGRLGCCGAIALLAGTLRAVAAESSSPLFVSAPQTEVNTAEDTVQTAQIPAQIHLEFGLPNESPSTADLIVQSLLSVPSRYDIRNDFEDESQGSPTLNEEDVDPKEPTRPNFWWRRDQLPTRWTTLEETTFQIEGGYRLIRNWTAFHSQSTDSYIVDVRVDPQYWNRYNDFQQYAILTQLGSAGISYGYHVRIYNSISLVGIYACDLSSLVSSIEDSIDETLLSDLSGVQCSAAIGPLIDYVSPVFEEDDLFNPP